MQKLILHKHIIKPVDFNEFKFSVYSWMSKLNLCSNELLSFAFIYEWAYRYKEIPLQINMVYYLNISRQAASRNITKLRKSGLLDMYIRDMLFDEEKCKCEPNYKYRKENKWQQEDYYVNVNQIINTERRINGNKKIIKYNK